MPRPWSVVPAATDAPAPAGAYSPAVRAGQLIFVSGQVPRDPRTGDIEGTEIRAQTRRVLANVAAVLATAGASLDDVVSVTAYLADAEEWDAFNDEYSRIFRPPYPTRTTIGAELRGIRVEVSVIAISPS